MEPQQMQRNARSRGRERLARTRTALGPRIAVQRYEELGGLELWSMYNWYRAGCYSAPMLWISAPCSPSVRTIEIRVDGVLQVCSAAGTMMADANDVCFVQRVVGEAPSTEECNFLSVAVPASSLEPELQLLYARRFRTQLTEDIRPAQALRRLCVALGSSAATALLREELLAELLGVIVPQPHADARACSTQMRKTRDFIHERWREPFSLDELARAVGLTKWHLTRSFTRAMGVRPSEYARTVRAAHALAELRRSASLARVASATGYSDQAHLSREIRRIFGFTPGAYRDAAATSSRPTA